MVWREQKDHVTDCYFCLTDTQGFRHKTRKKILYPSLPSAICPVAHSDQLPVPKPLVMLPKTSAESSQSSCNSEFEDEPNTNSVVFNQGFRKLSVEDELRVCLSKT